MDDNYCTGIKIRARCIPDRINFDSFYRLKKMRE